MADAVFTPHPGEMKRLAEAFGIDVGQTRIEQAKALAARLRSTIVLKGAHTVVAGKDGSCAVNLSGWPRACHGGKRRHSFRHDRGVPRKRQIHGF